VLQSYPYGVAISVVAEIVCLYQAITLLSGFGAEVGKSIVHAGCTEPYKSKTLPVLAIAAAFDKKADAVVAAGLLPMNDYLLIGVYSTYLGW
jgi:hypothetical protein